jgi:hypothetical protein
MTRNRLWLALPIAVLIPPSPRADAQRISETVQQAVPAQPDVGARVVVRGRVMQVHAPRLFTIEETDGGAREVLVLTPRALSTPVTSTTVEVRGVVRRFTEVELRDTPGWSEIDERVRERLAGRSVLVASSVIATEGDFRSRPAEAAVRALAPAPTPPGHVAAITLRPATLADNINELAGRRVRILNARVVGVFEPRAFLVEPATRYEQLIGHRDRILVLVDSASLRVSPALIVGSPVTIVGVARTLVGLQITAEVPWPATLDPVLIKRLEVRAAVLARSVQTPEGTELTDRQSPPER